MIADYPALRLLQTAIAPVTAEEGEPVEPAADLEDAQITAILGPRAPS